MTDGTKTPGFPPESGEITARFVMVSEHSIPPVIEGVPMFIYSSENRCGIFYLAKVMATPLYSSYTLCSAKHPASTVTKQRVYSIEATCMGPMPEAASFNYDHYDRQLSVFYGSDKGMGCPGQ